MTNCNWDTSTSDATTYYRIADSIKSWKYYVDTVACCTNCTKRAKCLMLALNVMPNPDMEKCDDYKAEKIVEPYIVMDDLWKEDLKTDWYTMYTYAGSTGEDDEG